MLLPWLSWLLASCIERAYADNIIEIPHELKKRDPRSIKRCSSFRASNFWKVGSMLFSSILSSICLELAFYS